MAQKWDRQETSGGTEQRSDRTGELNNPRGYWVPIEQRIVNKGEGWDTVKGQEN